MAHAREESAKAAGAAGTTWFERGVLESILRQKFSLSLKPFF